MSFGKEAFVQLALSHEGNAGLSSLARLAPSLPAPPLG